MATSSRIPAPAELEALRWRCIGPPRGGRVVAVAGDATDPMVFYFGACAGGVWKTTDGGVYWRCVSDGFLGSATIGALAVARSDPNVVYAGTGETTIRLDVSYGDGVYTSTDGGRTWRHVGLRETKQVGRICIHPQNPDLVYVAALGDAFGANEERGVYRSRDGGETWELARLWLEDSVPQNAETWLIAKAVKYIRQNLPAVKVLVSYADPSAGHRGTIYKAANWIADGRTDQERKTPT